MIAASLERAERNLAGARVGSAATLVAFQSRGLVCYGRQAARPRNNRYEPHGSVSTPFHCGGCGAVTRTFCADEKWLCAPSGMNRQERGLQYVVADDPPRDALR
jgi:hypothetical protein